MYITEIKNGHIVNAKGGHFGCRAQGLVATFNMEGWLLERGLTKSEQNNGLSHMADLKTVDVVGAGL